MGKDGHIGIFDTKGDLTARVAGPKAEALAKYIMTQNKKGKKLYGGIVFRDKKSWLYSDDIKYDYNPNNLKKWKFLVLN